jgi:hypothetical protein
MQAALQGSLWCGQQVTMYCPAGPWALDLLISWPLQRGMHSNSRLCQCVRCVQGVRLLVIGQVAAVHALAATTGSWLALQQMEYLLQTLGMRRPLVRTHQHRAGLWSV